MPYSSTHPGHTHVMSLIVGMAQGSEVPFVNVSTLFILIMQCKVSLFLTTHEITSRA